MVLGPIRRRHLAVAVAVAVTASVSACSFSGDSSSGTSTGAKGKITMEYPNIPTLDPQQVSWGEWLDGSALLEGLVVADPKGDGVLPGAAKSWQESNGGKTYTFTLRDAKWSDGKPVTAADFAWTYRRLLTPGKAAGVTQGANSYVPTLGIANAQEFQQGKTKDWDSVGVKVKDEKTLQLDLATPNTGFLLGLTHPSMLPLPKHVVSKQPKDWQQPENWVGNGPYVVKAWTVKSSMTLAPNKQYWDQKGVGLAEIKLSLTDDLSQAGVHFQNKEVDIALLASPADRSRFQKDEALASQLVAVPDAYSNYLAVLHSKNPALDDVRMRKALSLAMGREDVAKTCAGCKASHSLISPQVPDAKSTATVTEDVPEAKKLMAEAGHANGKGLPTVHILANAPNPSLDAIVANWKKNLGIKAAVDVTDPGVYIEKRQALQKADYVGFYAGAFNTFPTWRDWTSTLWGPNDVQTASISSKDWNGYLDTTKKGDPLGYAAAHASPEAKKFASLVQQGNAEADADQATETYKQAAQVRQDTYLYLPTTTLDNQYAVRSGIKGIDMRAAYLLPFTLKGVTRTANG